MKLCFCVSAQVEIVDTNAEYGHGEEGDIGVIVDNNPTYGQ